MAEKDELNTSPDGKSSGNGHRSVLLSTVLTPKKPVETDTDDFLETTRELEPDEYRKAFDKKVGGHNGFSASIRRTQRP